MSGNSAYANTAFKPALGELKASTKHPVRTKIRLFEIQNRNIFPEEGGDSPFPHPDLLGASILVPMALDPPFANPEAPTVWFPTLTHF